MLSDLFLRALEVRVLDDLWRDLAYAIRTLRRSTGFAAAAVMSIALGVGANTLVFSVVNGSVVYQASVNDATMRSSVVLIVAGVGLLASWLPARRALRLDPAAALHVE